MTITLTPELNRLIREKLLSGQYESVEEVLTAAMRALEIEDRSVAAIQDGIDDIDAGRYCTLEEANTEFCRKHGIAPLQ